jgi:L-methionine (R)-S-oxide reductase
MKIEKSKIEHIVNSVKQICESSNDNKSKLQTICELLRDAIDYYDWVGFYIQENDELVLGPYSGAPTEHTNITIGKGICGQVALYNEMMVVQDVSEEDNYLSCSVNVQSEIVLPIQRNEKFIAELDIDSHAHSPFSEDDRTLLLNVCDLLEPLF